MPFKSEDQRKKFFAMLLAKREMSTRRLRQIKRPGEGKVVEPFRNKTGMMAPPKKYDQGRVDRFLDAITQGAALRVPPSPPLLSRSPGVWQRYLRQVSGLRPLHPRERDLAELLSMGPPLGAKIKPTELGLYKAWKKDVGSSLKLLRAHYVLRPRSHRPPDDEGA